MKRFLLILLVSVFVANSYIAAAWAVPCVRDAAAPAAAEAVMPCHDAGEQQPAQQTPGKHCKGLCLCLHAVASSVADFRDGGVMLYPFPVSARVPALDAGPLASLAPPPLLRPPRILS